MKNGQITGLERLNGDAFGYFEHYKPILEKSGRFKSGDEKALARLCHLYSIADKLEDSLNNNWGVQLPKNDIPLYDKVCKSILLLESAFQMNPNARKEKGNKDEKPKRAFDDGKMKVA